LETGRGIGAVDADRLAKRGYDLILVGRSDAPLKAFTVSLASSRGRHITAIVADLNNKIDLAKVENKAEGRFEYHNAREQRWYRLGRTSA
jgi:short-subunit dehydrogenase